MFFSIPEGQLGILKSQKGNRGWIKPLSLETDLFLQTLIIHPLTVELSLAY